MKTGANKRPAVIISIRAPTEVGPLAKPCIGSHNTPLLDFSPITSPLPEAMDGNSRNLLHRAALNGHTRTVEQLLTLIEDQGKDGNTPLHLAAWEESY